MKLYLNYIGFLCITYYVKRHYTEEFIEKSVLLNNIFILKHGGYYLRGFNKLNSHLRVFL